MLIGQGLNREALVKALDGCLAKEADSSDTTDEDEEQGAAQGQETKARRRRSAGRAVLILMRLSVSRMLSRRPSSDEVCV